MDSQKLFAFSVLVTLVSLLPSLAVDRPNVVLLLSDDHNYRAIGCSGNSAIRTPNLDCLASQGVFFQR